MNSILVLAPSPTTFYRLRNFLINICKFINMPPTPLSGTELEARQTCVENDSAPPKAWRESEISKQSLGCQSYMNGGEGKFGRQQHVFRAGGQLAQKKQRPWTFTCCQFKLSPPGGQEPQQGAACLGSKCHSTARGQGKKPGAFQGFLASVSTPRCCQNNALPLNKISSEQLRQRAASQMTSHSACLWVIMVFIRDDKGEEKVGGLRCFI